jgi:hypothetical protein
LLRWCWWGGDAWCRGTVGERKIDGGF